uniref:Uncharacterized protein n=1 Tax=Anguilla anguilla TaxID=7936 RepID=A0A0E9T7K3_ANGAN
MKMSPLVWLEIVVSTVNDRCFAHSLQVFCSKWLPSS